MDSSRRANPGGSKSWRVLLLVERKLSWCKRGTLRHGRFPTQAAVLIDEDDARGGRAAMAAFPLKQND